MDNRTIDEVRRNEDRLINKIELLEKENQELKMLVENLKLDVTLNQKQEELLDKILFSKEVE